MLVLLGWWQTVICPMRKSLETTCHVEEIGGAHGASLNLFHAARALAQASVGYKAAADKDRFMWCHFSILVKTSVHSQGPQTGIRLAIDTSSLNRQMLPMLMAADISTRKALN